MADQVPILSGLSEIAPAYDALICDVWGVIHDGRAARQPAVEALRVFRRQGPVVLLSNAPRPERDLKAQFAQFGVPEDCYDAIMTSGMAARADLAQRAQAAGRLAVLHLGPPRDAGIFEGLAIDCVTAAEAQIVLCTGLYDDDRETPADYADRLAMLRSRGLTLLCANPDIQVQRGGRLVWCAGALAAEYEKLGGTVVYYGKPHGPIYDTTLALAGRLASHPLIRPLAIGDGLKTDVLGANRAGLDTLFIADGVHGEEIGALTPGRLGEALKRYGVTAVAAMPALMW